jgi:NADH-quinone oxidoreductase subunit G
MPFIKIDGEDLEVAQGTIVLEAIKQLGKEIPHYCYHQGLKIVASCRMCLVKIQGFPKLVPSCQTRIAEVPFEKKVDGKYDMVVITNDREVKDAQESILEFLLLNHPVDCPECDQAGECLLQDYSYRYGKDKSRFDFEKRVPDRKDLGPEILLVTTRCILCSRCIRFTQEITGTNELMVRNRGYHSEIDVFLGQSLNNKLSMNTADICPVGALVTKDFLFKPRNWRYQKTRSICPGCSVGCNINIESMEENNQIFRIKPEFNADVNQWWMCDEGRLLYHKYKKLERLEYPLSKVNNELNRSNWRSLILQVRQKLSEYSPQEIALVGSGYATNEENYLLQKIFRGTLNCENIAVNERFERTEDTVYPKFTIKGEKLPNYQGAVDALDPTLKFTELFDKIDKKEIKALYFLDGGPDYCLTEKELETLKKLDYYILQDIKKSPLVEIAHAVLAGASAYEKEGTFTNYKNMVQRIFPAILPPGAAKPDFEIIADLAQLFGLTNYLRTKMIFPEISQNREGYGDMDFDNLGKTGLPKILLKKAQKVDA